MNDDNRDSKANLFMVSAPSGAGKSTLVNALLDQIDSLSLSISYTTRPKRPSENNGENYHFIDEAAFKALEQKSGFLESAKVFDHYYGTPRAEVERELARGVDIMLEIDWQGAQQVRQLLPDYSTSIFILPPSLDALEQRLMRRQEDDPQVISARMAKARTEIAHHDEYDYLVINDDFDQALTDLRTIIYAKRLSRPLQARKYASLLANLLAK